jgi:hypothetical protein
MDIHNILIKALENRSIFHSEADFQHHLAWEINLHSGGSKGIRLEYPLSNHDKAKWEYCDILVRNFENIGIELKYKTKQLSKTVGGERFELKLQGAQDLGRYHFLKDVSRLENWCIQGKINVGYAIILTNDKSYWSPGIKRNANDEDFRLHKKSITGELSWGPKTTMGTMRGHDEKIILQNNYALDWVDAPEEGFKYLFLKVTG